MMETIKEQTYKNIKTIIHSDDPRDEYVRGDTVINGTAYSPEFGNGSYNLYNNRLLKAIPDGPGWYHFIDDDDEYAAPDVIEKLVSASLSDHVNVARVIRWNGVVFPKEWKVQKSYQTECFFLHTDHKHKAKWWGNLGGDHHYSKQLTRIMPINWIENLTICRAQEGKGRGKRLDVDGKFHNTGQYGPDEKVPVLGLVPYKRGGKQEWIRQGEMKRIPYALALELEKQHIIKFTHYGTYQESAPPRNILHI
jgi:hypothetical protein